MGTRANIVRKNADGSFDSIYTHWDGYPEHHAPILLEHYNTPQRVAMLLELGDLSSLGAKIGDKHDFHSCPEGVCNAYGRDRGEENTSVRHWPNDEALGAMLKEAWTEWVYVFDLKDGQWYYTNNPSPTWFKCCGTSQRELSLLTDWEKHLAKAE